MRIGVIFAIYNCEEFVDRCIDPWIEVRETRDIILTCISGRFSTYRDLGIPENNKGTISKLSTKGIDFLISTSGDKLLEEDMSRDFCLNYLKPHKCDIIWLVDGDELYTKEQILGIIDYVNSHPDDEGFEIYFKNYTIDYPYFINWWRPTLYRNRLYGGIDRFYFDSYFNFADGLHTTRDITCKKIPKNVAFIEHHAWVNRPATHDKIKYQKARYADYYDENWNKFTHDINARCQYESLEGKIIFNKDYAEKRNVDIPSLHEYPTQVIFPGLDTNYSRRNNRIEFKSSFLMEGYDLFVKDISGSKIYSKFAFNVNPVGVFWFIPAIEESELHSENFQGYRLELYKNENIVHIENIPTKIGLA